MELGPELHLSNEDDNRIYVFDLKGYIVGLDDSTLTEGYRYLPIKEERRLSLSLLSKVCLLYGLAETLLIIPGEYSGGDIALMEYLELLLPPDQPDKEELVFSFESAWNQLSRLPFAKDYVNLGKPLRGPYSGYNQRLTQFGCFELFISHTLSGILGACVSIDAPLNFLSQMIQLLHSNLNLKSYHPNYFIGRTILVKYLERASDELPEIPKLQQMHKELLQEISQKKGVWWFQNRDYIKMQISAVLDEYQNEELEQEWLMPLAAMIVSRGVERSVCFEGIHEQLREPALSGYFQSICNRDETKPEEDLLREAIIETLLQDLNERRLNIYSRIIKKNEYLSCQSMHDNIQSLEVILEQLATPIYQYMAIARHSRNLFLKEKAMMCLENRQANLLLFSFGLMRLNPYSSYEGVGRYVLGSLNNRYDRIGLLPFPAPFIPHFSGVRGSLSGNSGPTLVSSDATLSDALRIIDEDKIKAQRNSTCALL